MPKPASDSAQYFAESPEVASERTTVSLTLPDLTVDLITDRGVFSASRIDAGTKLLLLEAAGAMRHATHMLDLGCGYGPIAVTLAMRNPHATIWAVDTNRRALELCRDNAAALGLDNVSVVHPDEIDEELRFDLICSNPAIRIGKKALHEMLSHWLDRLATNGHAELVVQKHLGSDSLAKWLDAHGWPTTRLLSRSAYRILRVDTTDAPMEEEE